MIITSLLSTVALASAPTSAVTAQARPAAAQQPADFRAQAEAMVAAAYPSDGPGAAAVVTRGGRVIYSGGRGLADVEARRPITAETGFKLGSIAKQFTAAAVLQLVGEGKLSLDDPISRFFPDFPEPAGRATVRQLLNHTSGIQDYSKIPGWIDRARTRAWTTEELVAEVRNRPAKSEPGGSWEYNNAGYMMLGAIIEKVTGTPWHEVIAQRITRPLGLSSIAFGGSAGSAKGYSRGESGPVPAAAAHPSLAHAAGGLTGSAADLAKWAAALHGDRVVSPALYQEMIKPAQLADGSTQPYGFGLRLRQLRGQQALVHGGAGAGVDTDTIYIPGADVFVTVLSNSDAPATDPSLLTRRLAALALGEPFPTFTRVETPLAQVEPLFGAYRTERGPELLFFSRDGKLFLARGEDELEAVPAGGDRYFFGPARLNWIRFVRRADGAHVLEVHEPDARQPARAVRSGPVPPPLTVPAAVLQTYLGSYQTETLVVNVKLDEKGRPTIQAVGGRQPLPMRPVSQTEFRVDDAGGYRVVFHPENGAVNRLTIHRGARVLNGQRITPG